jgi:hypothetical protein
VVPREVSVLGVAADGGYPVQAVLGTLQGAPLPSSAGLPVPKALNVVGVRPSSCPSVKPRLLKAPSGRCHSQRRVRQALVTQEAAHSAGCNQDVVDVRPPSRHWLHRW